ncbi:MAG: hypothetical protein K2G93_05525 [Rikenella sp.]|nr:hypothetical protein [Rikenella sp.]
MNYISRFIIGTGLLAGLLVSGGCRKSTLRDDRLLPEDTSLVDAMLILHCNEMQTKAEASREELEKQINDLNLFFVHKHYPSPEAPEVRHYYFSSVDVAKRLKLTNIRLGKYRLYAVANAGGRLCSDSHNPTEPDAVGESFCSMTEDQIKDLVAEVWEYDLTRADNLAMSSVNENMEIKWAKHEGQDIKDEDIEPISISLERRVAKFLFSYELGEEMTDVLKIKTVGARYVPGRVALFKKNMPTAAEFLTTDYLYPLVDFGDGSNVGISKENPVIFYLPENMQGPVPEITDPKDRNGHLAPQYASYIFLDGESTAEDGTQQQCGFSIYLGENITDNFDVEGNAYYHVHLQLNGLDPDDIRISSLKINVLEPFPDRFKVNEPQEAIVEIVCSNYFYDELQLVCTAPGARGQGFQVIPVDESGNEGSAFEDVSGTGDFWYNVLLTDDKLGEQRVKCKVVYTQTQTATPIQMNLMLRSRYGMATVVDRKNIVVQP